MKPTYVFPIECRLLIGGRLANILTEVYCTKRHEKRHFSSEYYYDPLCSFKITSSHLCTFPDGYHDANAVLRTMRVCYFSYAIIGFSDTWPSTALEDIYRFGLLVIYRTNICMCFQDLDRCSQRGSCKQRQSSALPLHFVLFPPDFL